MRTTVTLDPDIYAAIKRQMKERHVSFKEAVNDGLRQGIMPASRKPFKTKTYNMGVPLVNLDKATQLAGQWEDEEIIRKMALGK